MRKEDFFRHTYIVGGSGSGKTELIRTIHDFVGFNTVTIDPHGDLAHEIGKTAYNIDPKRSRFVINPFDIEDKGQLSRERSAQEITELLKEIIRDVGLTSLMETIAYPIIYTLLKLPYADFRMFSDCINPTKGIGKLEYLRKMGLVEPHLMEIWEHLEGDTYETSKQSLFNRLQGFLNKRLVLQTVCGIDDFKTCFDLEKGVIHGNIVLNLSGLGADVCETLGRFFMTRLQIWARNREQIPPAKRTPVILIVDEFQNFIGDNIALTLDEYGRKFSLFMVLAHQHVTQLETALLGSIMANMKNKIAGSANMATRQKVAHELGISPDELNTLKAGHFWGRFGSSEAFSFYASITPTKPEGTRKFCPSVNGADIVDGWEGVDVDEPPPTKTTRRKNSGYSQPAPETPKPPKTGWGAKFDI